MIGKLFSWFESSIDLRSGPEVKPGGTFRVLWGFLRQVKLILGLMLILGLAKGFLNTALYYLVGVIVDLLSHDGLEAFVRNHGLILAGILFVLLIGRPALTTLEALSGFHGILSGFNSLVRWQLHKTIMRQSLNFFQTEFAGAITAKVWQSGQSASELVWTSLQVIWSNIVFFGSTIAILGTLNIRLGVIVLVWLLLFAVTAHQFVPEIRRRSRRSAEAQNQINGDLVDSYGHIQTLLLFSSDDQFIVSSFRKCMAALNHYFRATVNVRMVLAILNSTSITFIAVESLLLWRANGLTVGHVTLVLGLALQLDTQLEALMTMLTILFRAIGSFQSCMTLITRSPTITDKAGAGEFRFEGGQIVFEKVTFRYERPTRLIDSISFSIRPGEKIGLVGRSGAGKSTLVNLLLRFYDVESGRITVDGQDIRDITQASLRSQIGLMTQDTSLLHRSVRENIAIGKADATMAEIREAARHAHALEFIEALHDSNGRRGFDAHVGERGIQLSGGQRQRIGIARVLLKNAPILILDEATSALDSRLDTDIQSSLMEAMQGKTVLAIAHRLSTIAKMDRLLVIDGGQIVEDGSHAELLAKGGLYAELWQNQFNGIIGIDTMATDTPQPPRARHNVTAAS